jgi:hypothetical protein
MRMLLWVAALVAAALVLDRLLLWMEERRWINYRRRGLSRSAAAYHLLELEEIYNPGIRQVIELRLEERKREDEAGDPPVAGS